MAASQNNNNSNNTACHSKIAKSFLNKAKIIAIIVLRSNKS